MKPFSTMGLRPRHTAARKDAQEKSVPVLLGNVAAASYPIGAETAVKRGAGIKPGTCATILEARGSERFTTSAGLRGGPRKRRHGDYSHALWFSTTIEPSVTRAAGRARLQARGVGLVGENEITKGAK